MAVGDRIREARKDVGLTQEGLARRAGLTLKAVGEVERGDVQDPHLSSLTKIAYALGVTVGELLEEPALAAGKASAPPETGPEDLDELLDRVGARTRNLADPDLIRSLQGASDAAIRRTVRETRRELALLIPELSRLGDELQPPDPGFMVYNRALSWASQQVLALKIFLRTRPEPEPQEDIIALHGSMQKFFDMVGAAR